jgi:sucrose-6-phosphate hydrolase SacC (GH32 family)
MHDKADITPEIPLSISLENLKADGFDINIEIAVENSKRVKFILCGILVVWDSTSQMLNKQMPLPVTDGKIGFRALIDRASIEIFASNGASILIVKGLPLMNAPELSISSDGSNISVTKLEIYGLSGIYNFD